MTVELPKQVSPLQWLVVITVVAAALRLPLMFQPLWIDEIWSFYFAMGADSAWQLVAKTSHSNNHILNTLQMRLVGDQPNWFLYRLFPFVCGTATVFVIGCYGLRVSRETGIFAAILAACSLPLVMYSVEARGYAPLVLFSVLAPFLLQKIGSAGEEGSGKLTLQFWLACLLGTLSHVTFVLVFAGMIFAWAVEAVADRRALRQSMADALRLFLVPGVFVALAVVNVFSGLRAENTNQGPWYEAYVMLFAESVAVDALSPAVAVSAVFVVLVFIAGARFAGKTGTAWVLMAVPVPAVLFTLVDAPYMLPRYFLALAPFFILAAAATLAGLWGSRMKFGKPLAVVLTGTLLAAAAPTYARHLEDGRGNYLAAINEMFAQTGDEPFSVGSDHDFRNYMVLRFYTRFVPDAGRMTYRQREETLADPPTFVLLHTFDRTEQAEDAIEVGGKARYALVDSYRHSGASGWTWHLYRRE